MEQQHQEQQQPQQQTWGTVDLENDEAQVKETAPPEGGPEAAALEPKPRRRLHMIIVALMTTVTLALGLGLGLGLGLEDGGEAPVPNSNGDDIPAWIPQCVNESLVIYASDELSAAWEQLGEESDIQCLSKIDVKDGELYPFYNTSPVSSKCVEWRTLVQRAKRLVGVLSTSR